jgi:hypothetical protein
LENNKKTHSAKTGLSPVRWILAGALFLFLLAGTYTYVFFTLNSAKWAVLGVLTVLAATAVIAVVVLVLKNKSKLNKAMKWVIFAAALGVVLFNAYLLNSSYFVPHQTTTVFNRYFPESLETSVKLQEYLEGKTLYLDPTVTYFDRSDDQLSAIAHSYMASVKSSVIAIKTLEDPYGFLDDDDVAFLKAKTSEYEMVSWDNYREINAYFFYDVMDSDDVIVLWGRQMSMFFMTPETFTELKEMSR